MRVVKCGKMIDVYTIFRFMWLIILLPKTLQFVCYFIIMMFLLLHNYKIRIDKISGILFVFSAIHLCSIFINLAQYNFERQRVYAALNTCFSWVVAIVLYCIFSSLDRKKFSYERMLKYLYYNCLILSAVCVGSQALRINSFYFLGKKYLWVEDWLYGEYSLRFVGALGYSTLVAQFFLILFPFALVYLCKYRQKSLWQILIFMLLAGYTVYQCHSRLGIILFSVELILSAIFLLENTSTGAHIRKMIPYMMVLMLGIILLCYGREIYAAVQKLINGRIGSTSMRVYLYELSIRMTLQESPIWGMGIKIQPGNYPLGSHSTYIGAFYKTGFLGAGVLIAAIIAFVIRAWKLSDKKIAGKYFFICFLIYLAMLCMEDLDGYNWLLVTYFAILGSYFQSENSLAEIKNIS